MDHSSGTDQVLLPESHSGWQLGKFYFPAYLTFHHCSGCRFCLNARNHRKGKPPRALPVPDPIATDMRYWAPERLGWWIAVLFMIGSLCFAVGAWAASFPQATPLRLDSETLQNAVFFTGSLFFTSAATLQFIESKLAVERVTVRLELHALSFRLPERFAHLGYLSALAQWIGTLLFNLNTYDAMLNNGSWMSANLLVWTPDIIGSICFLVSSHFAYLEIKFDPATSPLSRRIVRINYLGSVAFMISALFAVALPHPDPVFGWFASLFTLLGALCFFIGAYLLIPELSET